jgi:hypothetical protein
MHLDNDADVLEEELQTEISLNPFLNKILLGLCRAENWMRAYLPKGAALLERQSSTNFQRLEQGFAGLFSDSAIVHYAASFNDTGIGAVG